MNPFVYDALAAVLFVLGLAAIGGAALGQHRNRRLLLAVAGLVLWGITLVVYNQATKQSATATPPTPTPVAAQPTQPAPEPTAAITTTTAISGSAPLDVTALPPIGGTVVFHSDRSGELDIYTLSLTTSNVQQLTDAVGRDFEPAWSPDGKTIAFSSDRDDPDNAHLYLMNADGSDQRRLISDFVPDQVGARWSPDGEWILFHSNPLVDGLPRFDIFKVRPDGSDLTNVSNAPGNSFMGDWSPDGSRIVFVSQRHGNRQLYVMSADGSGQVRLTNGQWEDSLPRWSLDGQSIIFESNRSGSTFSLYRVAAPQPDSADGALESTVQPLTHPGFNNSTPNWVNTEWLVYSSDLDSTNIINWELYLLKSDVSEIYRLTISPGMDRFPDWTP